MHEEPESNIHAAIYARVSTDDQVKGFSRLSDAERTPRPTIWWCGSPTSTLIIDNGVFCPTPLMPCAA
jgi:hypothetical protein